MCNVTYKPIGGVFHGICLSLTDGGPWKLCLVAYLDIFFFGGGVLLVVIINQKNHKEIHTF